MTTEKARSDLQSKLSIILHPRLLPLKVLASTLTSDYSYSGNVITNLPFTYVLSPQFCSTYTPFLLSPLLEAALP